MADDKELMLRLQRLEERVGLGSRELKAAKLTAAEIATYHKVESLLWEDGSCGINETSPCVFKCTVLKEKRLVPVFPRACDVECICGPCDIIGPVIRRGVGRFGGLGG